MRPRAASTEGSGKAIAHDRALRLAAEAAAMPVRDSRRIAASVAMVERLSEHWSLRGDERETLLGGIPKSTWSEWRQRPTLARIKSDTRERIANLFTIDLNAHALFAPEFADRWVREPNSAFGGESPMSTMLHGKLEDVITVRRYLERIRSSSPTNPARPNRVLAEKTPAVSYLPGDAMVADDEDAILSALRRAAAIYEQLALREPPQYRAALAAALSALGTRLEETNKAEAAPLLFRAAVIQSQVASELPVQEGTVDDQHRAADNVAWQTHVEPQAVNVIISMGMLDAGFNAALLARLREIELDPYASPTRPESTGPVRIMHMTYHGITWMLAYVISEMSRLIHIVSIEPERSETASSSAPLARESNVPGTKS